MSQRKSVFIFDKEKKKSKPSSTHDQKQSRDRKDRTTIFSTHSHVSHKPHCIYQPTYRLESTYPANLERMGTALERTVRIAIASSALSRYVENRATRFTQHLARDVQLAISRLEFDRYRTVALVTLVQKHNQSLLLKTGFLWDAEQDQWCKYCMECKEFYLIALVYAVYYE